MKEKPQGTRCLLKSSKDFLICHKCHKPLTSPSFFQEEELNSFLEHKLYWVHLVYFFFIQFLNEKKPADVMKISKHNAKSDNSPSIWTDSSPPHSSAISTATQPNHAAVWRRWGAQQFRSYKIPDTQFFCVCYRHNKQAAISFHHTTFMSATTTTTSNNYYY